jgi:hypothetical protein
LERHLRSDCAMALMAKAAETLQTLIGEVLDGQPFRRAAVLGPANWTRGHLARTVVSLGLRERRLDRRPARRAS